MGMLIDGPVTSSAIDSSGEILELEGLDISDFLEGKAYANFEHQNKSPEDIVGIFKSAKKIFSAKDCDNERQKMFWNQLKTPFLYGVCELFDDQDHFGAVAIAAMLRHFVAKKEKIQIGFSIEGATLKRDGNILERTIGRKAAITLKPCNRTCWVDLLKDTKSEVLKSEDFGIGSSTLTVEVDSAILDGTDLPTDPITDLKKALEDLQKTLTASGGNVAPSQLTGGAALSREHITGQQKNRIKAAVRDWNRQRPLKETIKAALPEVSDSYLDHFTRIAEDLTLKKGLPAKLVRIGAQHSAHDYDDDDQKKLLEGIYFDPSKSMKGMSHIVHGQNDSGDKVLIKDNTPGTMEEPRDPKNATVYHNMAKHFFNMGDHVPETAVVQHPQIFNGHPATVMKYLDGKHPYSDPKSFYEAANKGREDGSLHKLALMDLIMGNGDRHLGNAMLGKNGKINNIDNDHPFSYAPSDTDSYMATSASSVPAYGCDNEDHGYEGIHNDVPHIEAHKWLQNLDSKKFVRELAKYGPENGIIKQGVARLKLAQAMAKKGATIGQMYQAFAPKSEQEDPNA